MLPKKLTPQDIHEHLMMLTAKMPMKTIEINGKPYLERYYAGTFQDNKDLWLHRFLTGDSERHLHSHPFEFAGVMLQGKYVEDRICRITKDKLTTTHTPAAGQKQLVARLSEVIEFINSPVRAMRPFSAALLNATNQHNIVEVFDWHRIVSAEPDTWTALVVSHDRLPYWYFIDDSGRIDCVEASTRDWWKSHGVRNV